MRKYLLPSLLVLLLGAGFSFAQTINKALQLSQDTPGPSRSTPSSEFTSPAMSSPPLAALALHPPSPQAPPPRPSPALTPQGLSP